MCRVLTHVHFASQLSVTLVSQKSGIIYHFENFRRQDIFLLGVPPCLDFHRELHVHFHIFAQSPRSMSQATFATRKRSRAQQHTGPPPQRNFTSLRVKVAICNKKEKNPDLGPTKLAEWANRVFKPKREIDRLVVFKALKKKDVLVSLPEKYLDRSTIPSSNALLLDAKVKHFVDEIVQNGQTVSALQVILEARRVSRDKLGIPPAKIPKFTKSWVTRFMKRTDLSHRKLFGEAGSVKQQAIVSGRSMVKELTMFYHPNDIFNFDESAYFYRKMAVYTIAPVDVHLHGTKQDKTRVTMAVCTNASGTERLPLLIVGTAAMPVPFRLQQDLIHWVGTNDQIENPLFHYAYSKKGRMTGEIFRAWVTELNARMNMEGRKILLLVDNVSNHNLKDKGGVVLKFDNVNVQFLPKNTTAVLQPMDQGIIKATKDKIYYLRDLQNYNFYRQKVYKLPVIDLFTACQWCVQAFQELSHDTIKNAWRKADIIHDRFDNMYFWS
jgi:hypothetical protein